jgi:8-oxo-dGTP diphosphatase
VEDNTAQVTLTIDVAIFRFSPESKFYEILLIQRANEPYKGMYALPGGKLDEYDVSLEITALREVREETNLRLRELTQIRTFGDISRDPRGRYVSVVYASFVSYEESMTCRAGDDAAEVVWTPLGSIPAQLAFDHNDIVRTVIRYLDVRNSFALYK